MLSENEHVLFYGDSITDAGRNRAAGPGDPGRWGNGYVYQIAARAGFDLAEHGLTFTNQESAASRYDLESRLEKDVLAAHAGRSVDPDRH